MSNKMPFHLKALNDFIWYNKVTIPDEDTFNLHDFILEISNVNNKVYLNDLKNIETVIREIASKEGVDSESYGGCPNCGTDIVIKLDACPVCGFNLKIDDDSEVEDDDSEDDETNVDDENLDVEDDDSEDLDDDDNSESDDDSDNDDDLEDDDSDDDDSNDDDDEVLEDDEVDDGSSDDVDEDLEDSEVDDEEFDSDDDDTPEVVPEKKEEPVKKKRGRKASNKSNAEKAEERKIARKELIELVPTLIKDRKPIDDMPYSKLISLASILGSEKPLKIGKSIHIKKWINDRLDEKKPNKDKIKKKKKDSNPVLKKSEPPKKIKAKKVVKKNKKKLR